jgi:hypothetical protein
VVAAMNLDVCAFIDGEMAKTRASLEALQSPQYRRILADISRKIVESLRSGGKVMFCGNGGSAAGSQHLAAELVGRQNYDRAPAAGLALTVDTLTSNSKALPPCATPIGWKSCRDRAFSSLKARISWSWSANSSK